VSGGVFRRLSVVVRTVLGGEKLDELPEVPVTTEHHSVFKILSSRETLPEDVVPAPGKRAFLALLFGPEDLPCDPPPPPSGRESFLCRLFSREDLPRDLEHGSGAGAG
jgi:hypothetical protein